MALVTWEDIGGSVTQAENNISMGVGDQGFPFTSGAGTLNIPDYESLGGYDSWVNYLNSVKTIEYGKSSNGALRGGYFACVGTAISSVADSRYHTVLNLIHQKDTGYIPFVLRVDSKLGGSYQYSAKSFVFMLIADGAFNEGYGGLGCVFADGSFFSSTSLAPFLSNYVLDFDSTDTFANNEKNRLNYNTNNYTAIQALNTYLANNGLNMYIGGVNQPWAGVNNQGVSMPFLASPFFAGGSAWRQFSAQYYVDSNLPVWDVNSETLNEDVYRYIMTGTALNTWYSDEYEPAVDTQISDTTTIWNVQPMYDTNPICIVNYKTPKLGLSTSDVRSAWRGTIFIDSILNAGGATLKKLTKGDVVLYDKSYASHSAGMSMRYNRMIEKAYDFIGYNEWVNTMHLTPPATAQEGWWSSSMSPIVRLGMCVYTDNQISNIMYVDIHYDNTVQFEWGVLKDYGDESVVNITPKSTATIESEGGIANIERPDADDGYTGVDTTTEEENFDYDEGSGEYPDDTITPTSGTGVSVGGKFCSTYQVTTAQLKAISNYFWNDGSEGFVSKYINAVNNPIESILSVGYMPVSVSNSVGTDNVYIGNVNLTEQSSDCTGYSVSNTTIKSTIGSIEIPEIYSSFLDYQPYTNLTIFLPFIGFKTLPPNLFMGKTLTVEYVFDLITGACKAMLSANSKFVISFDGDCMIRVPLTASNNSDVFMQRLRSAVEAVVAVASTAVGSKAITSGGGKHVTGERFGRTHREAQQGRSMRRTNTWSEDIEREPTTYSQHAYGGLVSQLVANGLDIAMAKHTYETYGGASSATASVEPMKVYIIIDSPTVQYPATYNHNCGKPCELSKYLSSLTGYTEVDGGVDLSGIPCTEAERDEIHRLLVSGVYL